MDGSVMEVQSAASTEVVHDEMRPGNRSPAEHAWLNAESENRKANYAAYRLARPDLDKKTCAMVFRLCDPAQMTFITWLQTGKYVKDALAAAQAQHAALTKDTDP